MTKLGPKSAETKFTRHLLFEHPMVDVQELLLLSPHHVKPMLNDRNNPKIQHYHSPILYVESAVKAAHSHSKTEHLLHY